jgi:pimeloyl-ACP methyl ester carboxylesterase
MSYVLVHGAGFGRQCWDRLIPWLSEDVLAVDLPGRGSRADYALPTVGPDNCAQAIVDDVVARDLHDIVLVGHSLAGITIPRVMPMIADRLRHVVFISAVVPPHGRRVLDQLDPELREIVAAAISDGIYSRSRAQAQDLFCNDLEGEARSWILDQVVDDAGALLCEPANLSGLAVDVPRSYIQLSLDRAYPPDLQAQAYEIVRGDTITFTSGHMAMVSIPGQIAEFLEEL